jgi:hypothetical protein
LEWSCACSAFADPFDARIDTSNANNYTSNPDDGTMSNGKAITNTLPDGDDGTHGNADDGGTHANAYTLPDGNANDGSTHGDGDAFNIDIPYTIGVLDSGAGLFQCAGNGDVLWERAACRPHAPTIRKTIRRCESRQ